MDFQTRSEENGMRNFPTLKEAMQHATQDTTVWKVSFILPHNEAVRLVRQRRHRLLQDDQWVFESITFTS